MSSSAPKVLIVGAGPSGLVAALTLLQNNIPVRIIENLTTHRLGQRGSAVQPRSLELYHLLGVKEVLEEARYRYTVRLHGSNGEADKVFQMMPWVDPTPNSPYLAPLVLGQDHAERILRAHLRIYGCHIELGTTLVSFSQHSDYVGTTLAIVQDGKETTEKVDFDWIIGADGARSVVRKSLGLTFLGESRTEFFVTGDIRIKEGLSRDTWQIWGNTTKKALILRPSIENGSDVFQFIALGSELDHTKLANSRIDLVDYLASMTGLPTEAFGEIVWVSEYRPNVRMANRFREGRAFVVGDAAHVHTPAGGQGMNSSVQDSFNLGWKLALVCKNLASPALLDSYTSERLPVIAEMLNISTDIHQKTFASGVFDEKSFQRQGSITQLGVNYRGSNLIVDDRKNERDGEIEKDVKVSSYSVDDFLRGGDRAPDATGLMSAKPNGPSRLFDVFKPFYHTALIFSTDISSTSEKVVSILVELQRYPHGMVRSAIVHSKNSRYITEMADADFIFEDREDHAFEGYGVSKDTENNVTVVIVRPDGVIGAIVYGVESVQKYFAGIFV